MNFASSLPRLAVICLVFAAAWQPLSAGSSEIAVAFERRDNQIEVILDGQLLTAFHFDRQWDKPFFHPLRTASGRTISRGYPLEEIAGEHSDHEWHRGLWYGHGDVNGEDFWREIPERKTSRLELIGEPQTSGPTLEAELAMRTPAGETLGSIVEEFTFTKSGGDIVIDAAITIRADQGTPLTHGDTDDGGLGLRLAEPFRQENGATLRNSEGRQDTENIWGRQARWVDYSATPDGETVGVAFFDHPSNLRHPTRWHARGYSLVSAYPFGLGSFTGEESADGSYTIPAGESLTFEYRLVIYEGAVTVAEIERRYREFAQAP